MLTYGDVLDCGLADTNLQTQSRDGEHQRWPARLLQSHRAESFDDSGH
jgi:hypothetical protein